MAGSRRWSLDLVDRAIALGGSRLDAPTAGPHGRYEPTGALGSLVDYRGSLLAFRGTAVLVGWCDCDECLEWAEPDQVRALLVGLDGSGGLRLLERVRRCSFIPLSGPLARPVPC